MPDFKFHQPVNMQFGAPMGRRDITAADVNPGGLAGFNGRMVLRRVHLNSGGYDVNGCYWGTGMPIYWAAYEDNDTEIERTIRAWDREDAKEIIRQEFPLARFYR